MSIVQELILHTKTALQFSILYLMIAPDTPRIEQRLCLRDRWIERNKQMSIFTSTTCWKTRTMTRRLSMSTTVHVKTSPITYFLYNYHGHPYTTDEYRFYPHIQQVCFTISNRPYISQFFQYDQCRSDTIGKQNLHVVFRNSNHKDSAISHTLSTTSQTQTMQFPDFEWNRDRYVVYDRRALWIADLFEQFLRCYIHTEVTTGQLRHIRNPIGKIQSCIEIEDCSVDENE